MGNPLRKLKNISVLRTGLAVTTVAAALIGGAALPAYADTANSSAGSSSATSSTTSGSVNWGANHDGWRITVYNDSDANLNYDTWSFGVYTAPELSPHSTGLVLGRQSGLVGKGPANVNMKYESSDLAKGWERFITVSATSSGETTATCGISGQSQGNGVGCQILDTYSDGTGTHIHPDKPVRVIFTNLPDGPWKR